MHEFNLIQKYFTWENPPVDVITAVGDDAAVMGIPADQQLVTSIDTLISGVHFPKETSAHAIGYKALAVSLSDLAAMGATPKWFTLALTLPEIDQSWLHSFSLGLKTLAQEYQCFLVGGDTTKGSLSISIQVMGLVNTGSALLRSGAKSGDKIYVTGTLGDANAGLDSLLNGSKILASEAREFCHRRLNYPTPRLNESFVIKDLASSCIDLSDGLLQDLSHILNASKVGAELDLSQLPLSPALKALDTPKSLSYVLAGGDDYELLFTLPEENEYKLLTEMGDRVTCIGSIAKDIDGIVDKAGKHLESSGYNHFYEAKI